MPFWSPLCVPLPLPVESPESTPSEASSGDEMIVGSVWHTQQQVCNDKMLGERENTMAHVEKSWGMRDHLRLRKV